uniref:DUF4485 domain-containing protein n=1 Tax=Glossina brevipalpis TaxID=37001 RepID=A0A1A9WNT2_9MUSC
MAKVENEKEMDLDKDFERYVKELENLVNGMKLREKLLATEWIEKLKKSNKDAEQRKLRNRFIKHFIETPSVFSSKGFKNLPENFSNPLEEFKLLLPLTPDEILRPTKEVKQSYLTELFNNLPPEGTKFLQEQPVPRQGSLYIVVIARDEKETETRKSEEKEKLNKLDEQKKEAKQQETEKQEECVQDA